MNLTVAHVETEPVDGWCTYKADGPIVNLDPFDRLLTPAEAAALFGVTQKTVWRWARAGKLPHIRTLGGHRRFLERDVLALRRETVAKP